MSYHRSRRDSSTLPKLDSMQEEDWVELTRESVGLATGEDTQGGFRERSLDGIITDLPWGIRELTPAAVARLYPALLRFLGSAVVDGCYGVFLCVRDKIFTRAVEDSKNMWELYSRKVSCYFRKSSFFRVVYLISRSTCFTFPMIIRVRWSMWKAFKLMLSSYGERIGTRSRCRSPDLSHMVSLMYPVSMQIIIARAYYLPHAYRECRLYKRDACFLTLGPLRTCHSSFV